MDNHVLDLAHTVVESASPFTKSDKGRWVRQPEVVLSENGMVYTLTGRKVLWSFLDAIFDDDPLPRDPVMEAIYAPMGTGLYASLWDMMTGFIEEAGEQGTMVSLFTEQDLDIVVGAAPLGPAVGNLDMARDWFRYQGAKPYMRWVPYRHKKISLVPSVSGTFGDFEIEVMDLGKTYYGRVTCGEFTLARTQWPNDWSSRGLTVKKMGALLDWVNTRGPSLSDIRHLTPQTTNLRSMTTREADDLLRAEAERRFG